MRQGITYFLCLTLGLIFMAPFFWAFFSALKDPFEIFEFPPRLFPSVWRWGNFVEIWVRVPFAKWTVNTLLVCILSLIGQVSTATLVAYGFSRFRFPGREKLFLLVLSTMMLPFQVTLIPLYLMYRAINWLDTLKPLIVPNYFGGGAFYIFLIRQFLMTVPRDLDEAAKIDGAGSFRILWQVILPLIKPALLTVTIFSFMSNWNNFLGPLFFLNDPEKFTLSLGLRYFQGLPTSGEPKQHLLMAASITMTIPVLILFFFTQRYFVQGIITTGIKM
ncbi:MAG: carbohydrate ABC transporter permease [Anaerolineae bacterium]|nr:carbohydrate ABC transporter permease [Anaerolineae bacterium]